MHNWSFDIIWFLLGAFAMFVAWAASAPSWVFFILMAIFFGIVIITNCDFDSW